MPGLLDLRSVLAPELFADSVEEFECGEGLLAGPVFGQGERAGWIAPVPGGVGGFRWPQLCTGSRRGLRAAEALACFSARRAARSSASFFR